MNHCPFCRATVEPNIATCPHCHRFIQSVSAGAPVPADPNSSSAFTSDEFDRQMGSSAANSVASPQPPINLPPIQVPPTGNFGAVGVDPMIPSHPGLGQSAPPQPNAGQHSAGTPVVAPPPFSSYSQLNYPQSQLSKNQYPPNMNQTGPHSDNGINYRRNFIPKSAALVAGIVLVALKFLIPLLFIFIGHHRY